MSASLKVAIVTGANTGVGKETVRGLAKTGQFKLIVLGCRSERKAIRAIEDLQPSCPSTCNLQFLPLDLESFASVRNFVKLFLAFSQSLHVLINNAGLSHFSISRNPQLTKDGIEPVVQINYYSHFLLTLLLLDVLKKSAPSRVVNVSSAMHRWGSTDFECSAFAPSPWSYSSSKLAQVYFSYEFNRRYLASGVFAVAVNPGAVDSEIWEPREPQPPKGRCEALSSAAIRCLRKYAFLTPAQGASTSIYAATELVAPAAVPSSSSKRDDGDDHLCVWVGPYLRLFGFSLPWEYLGVYGRAVVGSSACSTKDPAVARSLWELSVRLTGLDSRN